MNLPTCKNTSHAPLLLRVAWRPAHQIRSKLRTAAPRFSRHQLLCSPWRLWAVCRSFRSDGGGITSVFDQTPPKRIVMSPEPINVLFCCLGNICRSPMAEAVFRHAVQKQRADDRFGVIDSCGTAHYHEGEEPHSTYVPSHTHTSTVKVCQERTKFPLTISPGPLLRMTFTSFTIFSAWSTLTSRSPSTNNVKNLQRMQPKDSKAQCVYATHDNRVKLFSAL